MNIIKHFVTAILVMVLGLLLSTVTSIITESSSLFCLILFLIGTVAFSAGVILDAINENK